MIILQILFLVLFPRVALGLAPIGPAEPSLLDMALMVLVWAGATFCFIYYLRLLNRTTVGKFHKLLTINVGLFLAASAIAFIVEMGASNLLFSEYFKIMELVKIVWTVTVCIMVVSFFGLRAASSEKR